MAEQDASTDMGRKLLEDMQHWTWVVGRAQQKLLEFAAELMTDPARAEEGRKALARIANLPDMTAQPMKLSLDSDPAQLMEMQARWWSSGIDMWKSMMDAGLRAAEGALDATGPTAAPAKDRRFGHAEWESHPLFSTIRQAYLFMAERMMDFADTAEGLDAEQREKLRFGTRSLVDALAPTNFALTNPAVIERAIQTRGESLLKGLDHMLGDLRRGQLTHTDRDAFELGRNIAVTPGKVVHETPLYQLIQYSPTTDKVLGVPLIVFPPWINRFYILDLNPEKSFVRWAVEQGITLYMVSWKSADASMSELVWDDYVKAQIDAIDTVRGQLDVPSVHTIGYCVAGTTLSATLALLAARGEADKVKSATFFTAQVDFQDAGDLKFFLTDEHLALLEQLSEEGYLDGRYMAATFNLLRSRDLIWNYVVNNYLMGDEYPAFDLLHWNSDTTNLPRKWHRSYLEELYRDNLLVLPGAIAVDGTPIDLTSVKTPAYIQAGREDHIAPAQSVWRIMDHFSGPKQFMLAGSGHIAGVVNPPSLQKYQYWTNEAEVGSLDEFIAGATETKGSWWPHWLIWLRDQDTAEVPAKGARVPGKGKAKAIEDAPGRYVRER